MFFDASKVSLFKSSLMVVSKCEKIERNTEDEELSWGMQFNFLTLNGKDRSKKLKREKINWVAAAELGELDMNCAGKKK